MGKNWGGLKGKRWDNKDPWQYQEEENNYGWIKQLIAAVLIFALVYGAHVSDTSVGKHVSEGVHYILATETDFNYYKDLMVGLANRNLDVAVLKRLQSTVIKPVDPLMYMKRPIDGKVISLFGWQTDPVSKQSVLKEGIELEAEQGSAVKAAAAGKVKVIAESTKYGKIIIIQHSSEIESLYGYLGEILVNQGDTVSQAQVIARSGKSNNSQPLLYFEIRENGKTIDPLSRIKSEVQ